MNGSHLLFLIMLALLASVAGCRSEGDIKLEKEQQTVRQEFLDMRRPLVTGYTHSKGPQILDAHIERVGPFISDIVLKHCYISVSKELEEFINRYDRKMVLAVLLPLLDDPKYSGDACAAWVYINRHEYDTYALAMRRCQYYSPEVRGHWGLRSYDKLRAEVRKNIRVELRQVDSTRPTIR